VILRGIQFFVNSETESRSFIYAIFRMNGGKLHPLLLGCTYFVFPQTYLYDFHYDRENDYIELEYVPCEKIKIRQRT
jgi:hypothetical protein